jgi:hypothetical protein
MTLLVVSTVTNLALALGTRADATGIEPADLDRFLADDPVLSGAVVDVGTGAAEVREIVAAFRGRDLSTPIVVIGDPAVLPDGFADANSPLGFVTRPFTIERLLDSLRRLGVPAAVAPAAPPPTPTEDDDVEQPQPQAPEQMDMPASEPPAADEPLAPVVAVTPPEAAPPSPPKRRGLLGRSRGASDRAAPRMGAIEQAVSTLLATDELYSVAEVATAMVTLLRDEMDDDVAVMVLDDDGWRVAAGSGLRPIEMRGVLPRAHWLAQRLESEQSAVIVDGTDLVRQQLSGVPLIHHNQWLATTLEQAPAMVVMGRQGDEAYDVEDALVVRALVAEPAAALGRATQLRRLARRLDPLRD